MELLKPIESQLISNRLPLVAVTVAAVPYANTPIVLGLHWHGFVEVRLLEAGDTQPFRYESVPSSALQLNERWDDFSQLDHAALEVAWELGAWDMARFEAAQDIVASLTKSALSRISIVRFRTGYCPLCMILACAFGVFKNAM